MADERFDITFEKVIDAACVYNGTGYNSSYMQVYKKDLRERLIVDPDAESVKQLIEFVNSWRNRTPHRLLPELLEVFTRNTGGNAALQGVDLESSALDDAKLKTVQHIFEELCSVPGFGATGASKFLGIVHPQLCVMWDIPIREAYGCRWSKVPRYSGFLRQAQVLAKKVMDDATKNHGIVNPADCISDMLDIRPHFTLATFINHYLWVTFTIPVRK